MFDDDDDVLTPDGDPTGEETAGAASEALLPLYGLTENPMAIDYKGFIISKVVEAMYARSDLWLAEDVPDVRIPWVGFLDTEYNEEGIKALTVAVPSGAGTLDGSITWYHVLDRSVYGEIELFISASMVSKWGVYLDGVEARVFDILTPEVGVAISVPVTLAVTTIELRCEEMPTEAIVLKIGRISAKKDITDLPAPVLA